MRQQSALAAKKANGIPDFSGMACQSGKWLSPCTQHSLGHVLSTEYLPSLGLPIGKIPINWTEFSTGAPYRLATAAFALSGEAQGVGLVHPGAGMVSGGESSSPPAHTGRASRRWSQDLDSGAWEDKSQHALAETTEVWPDIRRNCFMMRTCPKKDIQSPCSLIFKTKLTEALSNLSGLSAHSALSRLN